MANPFDQFDDELAAGQGGNPFDRFDPPASKPRQRGPSGAGRRHDDAVSKVRTASGGFLEGIPVVGPLIRGGVDRAAAATLAGLSDEVDYDEALRIIQEVTAEEKAANPWTNTGAQLAGAVAGTVPLVMAAPVAFGAGGGGIVARSAASAASGAAMGGADAAVRSGGDLRAAGRGAVAGGAVGAVAPAAGQLIGAGGRKLVDAFKGAPKSPPSPLTRAAERRLVRAMDADGLSAAGLDRRLTQLGPNAMIADAGANLQQEAAGLVAKPGPARGIVQTAIRERDAGANGRILQTLDDTLGPAPIPSRVDQGIRDGQRAIGPLYQEAFRDARAVDTRPIAEALDSQIVNLRGDAQRAVRRVRAMLDIPGTRELDPFPGALFQVRQALDDMVGTAQGGNLRRVLTETRAAVDETLTRAVPRIKQIDGAYAEMARQRGAIERGQTVLRNGPEAIRPAELVDEFAASAAPQGLQIGPSAVPLRLRQGARAEIDRIVGQSSNDRAALQRMIAGEGDWSGQKLATLFGPEKARRILDVLDAERVFADTSNFVTKNSATAARNEAVRDLDGTGNAFGLREGYIAGGSLGALRATGMRAIDAVVGSIMAAKRTQMRTSLGKGLTKGGRDVVEALLRREQEVLRQQLLARQGAAIAVPALVGPTVNLQNGSPALAR